MDEPDLTAHFKNHPNPFQNQVTVAFSFEKNEDYKLDILDLKGSLVKRLQTGKAKANRIELYRPLGNLRK